jgi:queuine tRNA-ribosyltransferase
MKTEPERQNALSSSATNYELQTTNLNARVGVLRTAHGEVPTPAFMTIGTAGAVKGLLPEQLQQVGCRMLLANAYHLLLRPGPARMASLGGLHRLMGWDGPVLTDSGGYQVFSLAAMRKVDDEGVTFRSHVDGATVRLTPESMTAWQRALGSDVMMALDVCPPLPAEPAVVAEATRRTMAWAARCRAAYDPAGGQRLLGIVQGGLDGRLRGECAARLVEIGFDGYALGGLSVGETHEQMLAAIEATVPHLPADRPRYLMGVGTPRDIVQAVARGIDLFDCVLPTRNGRNGQAFTAGGLVRLRNAAHGESDAPVEADCDCPACRRFSRGAIRHLLRIGHMNGPILVSLHNVAFYMRLMRRIRGAVADGTFDGLAASISAAYA